MSRIDKIYKEKALEIIENGINEKEVSTPVRPVWVDENGNEKPAYTQYITQQFIEYKVGEVPLINLRKIAWKSAIKEIFWIYQDKSNDVNLLNEKYNIKYWDSWKNSEGNLGTAYGYQINKEFISPETKLTTNQIDRLIEQLKNNPLNRRLIISLYDVNDLHDMTLIPCAFMTLWSVRGKYLDMTLIQRSGDFLAAAGPGGINAFQYYVLMRMIAQVTGHLPGKFIHFVQNLHLYDRHLDIVNEICGEDDSKDGVKLWINPEIKNFYDFKIDDFKLENYYPSEKKYKIDIAI